MQINHNSTGFRANLVANCGKIDLYKVSDRADIIALKNYAKKVDFHALMPNLDKQKSDRWHEMLDYGIDYAESPGNVTYVGAFNNKICGIITYFPDKTAMIDCICTIPTKVGEKVKFAGKSLFYQVFKDIAEIKSSRAKLSAITNGPFNTIEKYEELGFRQTTDVTATTVKMEANQYKIREALEYLSKLLQYKKADGRKIDLASIL